jgi:hypothetical protein
MSFPLEYHSLEYDNNVIRSAQRSIPVLLALFGTLLLPVILVNSSSAQFTGASSSGGHSFSTAPPTGSVAPPTGSIAPPTGAASAHNGFGLSASGMTHSGNFSHSSGWSTNSSEHHRPHRTANGDSYYPYAYPYAYAVPVPYADATDGDSNNDDDDDPEYQGGPTVFDRRGAGAASYIPPSYEGPAHAHGPTSENASVAQPSADGAAESPQSPTTLVFKDGHQVEVENYAIVAQTLYDLSPGHPRKIALADLDLPATEKQNDDRGVTFQLPPSTQEN